MQLLTKEYIASLIKPRTADSHKGTHGHALLIAGSKGKMGACVIASRACLRTGAGLLTTAIPEKERYILQTAIPEAMLVFHEDGEIACEKYDAVGIGPAIGTDASSEKKLMTDLIAGFPKPMLLDADALTLLSKNVSLWDHVPANSVLTPHPKEFDRIAGESKNADERKNKAISLASEKNVVIVLKGYQTLITHAGASYTNTTGNAGLAKGGTGDLLTGMITSLLAQGYTSIHASCIGVFLHGLAADITLETQSEESMLASDVAENIGRAFISLR